MLSISRPVVTPRSLVFWPSGVDQPLIANQLSQTEKVAKRTSQKPGGARGRLDIYIVTQNANEKLQSPSIVCVNDILQSR